MLSNTRGITHDLVASWPLLSVGNCYIPMVFFFMFFELNVFFSLIFAMKGIARIPIHARKVPTDAFKLSQYKQAHQTAGLASLLRC